ncbi:cupin domain-containing protein [Paenibacillus sp. M1]|uniref:Cupin domain-containing protein n=1 Tax=Paenibacillus haidiansis TaxID=1574488 RepID=A0ABU7VWG7_9BACL
MINKISKKNAGHYIWGGSCDGWRLVDEAERSIIHERMPAGMQESRHVHRRSRQFFFVLSGTMNIEIDGTEHILREQEGIDVPADIPHQVFNKSANDLEFLVISQPNTKGDRFPAE